MRKTDYELISWPETDSSTRKMCRKMINAAQVGWQKMSCYNIIVACSGGLDSSVLVDAVKKGIQVSPYTNYPEVSPNIHVVYVNHGLRPEENKTEIAMIKEISRGHIFEELDGKILYGSSIQERAREVRYRKLVEYAKQFTRPCIYTAHTVSDVIETKLFRFLTGRTVGGIASEMVVEGVPVVRPFLHGGGYKRSDISVYADLFAIKWHEDSSNDTNNYSRNKIRHDIIPCIQETLGVDLSKTLW